MDVGTDNGSELSSGDTELMELYRVFVYVCVGGGNKLIPTSHQNFQKMARKCFEKSEKILHRCWTLQKEA